MLNPSLVAAAVQGYIDLSKRRVSAEEAKKCEEKFNKGKAVNSILRHVADLEKAVGMKLLACIQVDRNFS